ncbi:hypothetical protein DYQ86_14900 [Acidobacteria bacterium AB60]|nr:hypothetical protein DYQ86_14900 [Acidobacteria bacterium AB60]
MPRMLVVCLLGMASIFAHATSECRVVGGAISTNFVNPTTTAGTATGDLAGSVGVSVLKVTPNASGAVVFHNQHTWVTATGDTIQTDPADATAFPTSVPGFYAASYLNGVVITGGTGRFAKASGKVFGWGAVNLATNELVLRYEGTVCFADGD